MFTQLVNGLAGGGVGWENERVAAEYRSRKIGRQLGFDRNGLSWASACLCGAVWQRMAGVAGSRAGGSRVMVLLSSCHWEKGVHCPVHASSLEEVRRMFTQGHISGTPREPN